MAKHFIGRRFNIDKNRQIYNYIIPEIANIVGYH
jgi:hypothetical protein